MCEGFAFNFNLPFSGEINLQFFQFFAFIRVSTETVKNLTYQTALVGNFDSGNGQVILAAFKHQTEAEFEASLALELPASFFAGPYCFEAAESLCLEHGVVERVSDSVDGDLAVEFLAPKLHELCLLGLL